MNKIVIANWKMHPDTLPEAEDLYHFSCDACAAGGGKILTVICPPFVYLEALSRIKSSTLLGAQNCHWEDRGAFTGEVSPKTLKSLGAKYVIIGHSERRWLFGETDELINKKLKAALRNELTPILAVGERNKGDDRGEILSAQLKADLEGIDSSKILVAYEPVWAIGTGAETPEHTLEAVEIIRRAAGEIPVLYGGSVDSNNVGSFVSKPEIAGILVGGASLDKEEFSKILRLAGGL